MTTHSYIACDLGAESGRVILGTLAEGRLTLEEIHRFPNGPVQTEHGMRWDIHRLFDEIKTGLKLVAARSEKPESISVDSWGVDYVLVDGKTDALALPYHYRDPRTDLVYAEVQKTEMPETIFAETGIQFMPINSLYQLLAHQQAEPETLADADHVLLIADYFGAKLSGVGRAERSLASTTQLYNPATREWSKTLTSEFKLPAHLLPPLADSGTMLGPLLPEIAAETGLQNVQVIATCSHDTGAAVAAVPEEGDDWAFLSSGTWSLLGVELSHPLINAEVQQANFTNEIGFGGTVRFLKNIAGLWIVQECRRTWLAKGKSYTYDELIQMAEASPPLRSLLNPADPRFLAPGGMPGKVREFCRSTGQPVPETPGEIVRCALESLALSYKDTLTQIEALTGRTLTRLHIVGGGSRNALLNQFAADATGRKVLAGPVEATAIGNVLLQAVTLGHLDGAAALRRTVQASFPIQSFAPGDFQAWQEADARFQLLETHL